jgi:hypothetical protein
MSNVDKTYRIGVDASSAQQGVDRLRRDVSDANKQSTDSIKEQIRLLKEKMRLEEESARKRQKSIQEDIRYAQRDLEQWKIDRERESSDLSGKARKNFKKETREEELARREQILRDKGTLADSRLASDEERSDRKKQLKQLQELNDTTKTEGNKSRNVFEGVKAALTGNGSGMMRAGGAMLGGTAALGAVGLAYAIFQGAKNVESGMEQYSAMTGQSKLDALLGTWNNKSVSKSMGVSRKAFLTDYYTPYSYSGGREFNADDVEGLGTAEQTRNIPRASIQSLISSGRYSTNGSSISTIASLEEYLRSTNRAIIQLPEILQTYIGTANEILQRTGKVDALGIQRTIASIGSSYGVEGQNLDRFMGMSKLGGMASGDPIMFALQQRVLKRLYPNAGAADKLKIMQSPAAHPEYLQALVEGMKDQWGTGDLAKIRMQTVFDKMGINLGMTDIDEKIFSNKFKLKDFKNIPTQDANKYYEVRGELLNKGVSSFGAMGADVMNGLMTLPSSIVTAMSQDQKEFLKDLHTTMNKSNDYLANKIEVLIRAAFRGVFMPGSSFTGFINK